MNPVTSSNDDSSLKSQRMNFETLMPACFPQQHLRPVPHIPPNAIEAVAGSQSTTMESDNAATVTPQQVFCCPSCPIERKANIPPSHPLHQLFNHLSIHQDDSGTAPEKADTAVPSESSTSTSSDTIPGANECAIIIISDPNISPASSAPTFDPSRVTSRMYWGRLTPSAPSTQSNLPSPTSSDTAPAPSAPSQEWEWKEKADARNNIGGILREVDGNQEGRLRKEMTGYQCREHGWRFTFVVLIGVDPRIAAREAAQKRLLEMAAEAGAKDGAVEGAPNCSPQ